MLQAGQRADIGQQNNRLHYVIFSTLELAFLHMCVDRDECQFRNIAVQFRALSRVGYAGIFHESRVAEVQGVDFIHFRYVVPSKRCLYSTVAS